ncbi:MAG: hypothetical protein IJH65_16905 [Methanobrevibacter sp.]|nr:hypothetical protein [Methanobrevibacter sp.]
MLGGNDVRGLGGGGNFFSTYVLPTAQLATGLFNGWADRKANEELNQKALAFQERQNTITRMREDNAYRRTAMDMYAAGINPLYNGATPVSVSGGLGAPSLIPQNMAGAFNTAIDAFNTAKALAETERSNKAAENTSEEQLKQKWEEINEQIGLNTKQKELINAQISKLGEEESKTAWETVYLWQQMEESKQKALNLVADTALKNAQQSKEWKTIEQLTKNLDMMDTEKLKAIQELKNLEKEFEVTEEQIRKLQADIILQGERLDLDKLKEENAQSNAFWDRVVDIFKGIISIK